MRDCDDVVPTVGPNVIELLWAEKRASTGVPEARDDPLGVQTKR